MCLGIRKKNVQPLQFIFENINRLEITVFQDNIHSAKFDEFFI